MLTRQAASLSKHVRSGARRIFYLFRDHLGIRRFRGHSFFGSLLTQPAVVADFGAHRGEFFAALRVECSISRALLVEADQDLASFLKETFGNQADVRHAALVGRHREATITFTRSIEPETSSIVRDWSAGYGVLNQVEVPTIDFAEALRQVGGRMDLGKIDIEGAEFEVLKTASASDLSSCSQLTVEFHHTAQSMRREVGRFCQRMRREGYGIVNAGWPFVGDILFVNLRRLAPARRLRFRCRMALANGLFILRGTFLCGAGLLKGIPWSQLSLP